MSTLALGHVEYLVIAAGLVILVFAMMRANRQRLARLRGDEPTLSDRVAAATAAGEVRDQLDELMVQLAELARTTNAQIDTRFSKLELVVKEADEKIARLQSLLATAGREGSQPDQGGEESPAAPGTGQDPGPPESRPDHRRVYELADAGQSPVQIAREVGRDVGEVELILALRKKE